MKKLIILCCFVFFIIPIVCCAIVSKSFDIYVTDSANIIDRDTEEYIKTYSKFFYENNNIDYYVVTVSSFDGIDADEYIDYVYDSFNMSQKGILILASSEDRILKVKVGTKLSEIVTDEIIDEYIESYFMPYLKNGDWNSGIRNGYSAFYKMLCNFFDIDSTPMNVYTGKNILDKYQFPIITVIIWACTIIGYKLSIYVKKYYIKKQSKLEFLILLLTIVNVFFLYILYILNPFSLIAAFVFEIFGILDTFFLSDNLKNSLFKKN